VIEFVCPVNPERSCICLPSLTGEKFDLILCFLAFLLCVDGNVQEQGGCFL